MRLSRHARYALRVVLDLAGHPRGRSAEIARRRAIPPAYMPKIVQRLTRAGIVRTFRGTGGGVELVKPPAAVTLREVIEAAEGPLAITLCALLEDCPCVQPCAVRTALARVHRAVARNSQRLAWTRWRAGLELPDRRRRVWIGKLASPVAVVAQPDDRALLLYAQVDAAIRLAVVAEQGQTLFGQLARNPGKAASRTRIDGLVVGYRHRRPLPAPA
ncbi:MAG TPA: Rrf2 family transcriptional regulator [bacterium]|jgi:Rrf2 family protein